MSQRSRSRAAALATACTLLAPVASAQASTRPTTIPLTCQTPREPGLSNALTMTNPISNALVVDEPVTWAPQLSIDVGTPFIGDALGRGATTLVGEIHESGRLVAPGVDLELPASGSFELPVAGAGTTAIAGANPVILRLPQPGTWEMTSTSVTVSVRGRRADGSFITWPYTYTQSTDTDMTVADMTCTPVSSPARIMSGTVSGTPAPTPTVIPEPPTPAPTVIPEPPAVFSVNGTARLRTLTQGAAPVSGSLTVRRNGADFAGDLAMATGAARFQILGFIPLGAKLTFAAQSQLTGTFSDGSPGSVFSGSVQEVIRLADVSVLGIPLNTGPDCGSTKPMTLKFTGPFGPFGGALGGTFAISGIGGCGAWNGLLTGALTGGSNKVALSLR